MSEVFKTLFSKALDDLDACQTLVPKSRQHDNAGKHLHACVEKLFKAYLELSGITSYPTDGKNGHDLSLLLRMLQKTDFPVSDFTTLLKLQMYDSSSGYKYTLEERQVSLKSFISIASSLKDVVLRKYSSRQKN